MSTTGATQQPRYISSSSKKYAHAAASPIPFHNRSTTAAEAASSLLSKIRILGGNGGSGRSNCRTNNNSSKQQTKKQRWLIGGSMFCLVLLYFVIVLVVTQSHLPPPDQVFLPTKSLSSSSSSSKQQTQKQNHQQPDNQGQHVSPLAVLAQHSNNLQEHHEQLQKKTNNNNITHAAGKLQMNKYKNKNYHKNQANQPNKQKKQRKNPFKMYNLSFELNHGVDFDVLIQRDAAAIEAAAAHRFDPPLERHRTPHYVLTAYLEPPNWHDEWEMWPLPIRSRAQASNLQPRHYTRLNSCQKLTQQWPVDDTPSEDDPFLPWIHDVFPTADGKFIQFVAQNRRRCRTGTEQLNQTDIMMKMQPQAALFQHVPVKRVNLSTTWTETRYRLSTHADADPDGIATRFICRFKPSLQETLSVFNFDYDWIAHRKRYRATFLKEDGGIKSIHTSQLTFQCPVPTNLQQSIRTGEAVQNDWATLFVDLIPIRTPPRYGMSKQFFQPRYQEFLTKNISARFDPVQRWGNSHILPRIQDSGRWENIPICLPSLMQYAGQTKDDLPVVPQERQEKHRLVSCLWASAGYTTRGNRNPVNDGQRRLLEWLSYNKITGFDHFYVYDNSGAFDNNETSLKPITDLFPDMVTYIPWPSQICNNRPNNVESPGERSSQYAAETSCRLRFGPHTKWIGQFDIDEYLVPMGNHQNVTSLLDDLEKEDTRIISFASWRAWPRRAFVDDIHEINDPDVCWHNEACFHLTIPRNVTLLQAYNCDRQPPGKKTEVMPAEKQLYRADYVTQHFVHYSCVTKLSEKNRTEWERNEHLKWRPRAFPDPRQRFAKEETEALMLHTKAVAVQDTAGYKRMCSIENLKLHIRRQGLCRLGMPWPKPWPEDPKTAPVLGTKDGLAYNCFVNDQIEHFLVPRLEEEMKKHVLAN